MRTSSAFNMSDSNKKEVIKEHLNFRKDKFNIHCLHLKERKDVELSSKIINLEKWKFLVNKLEV